MGKVLHASASGYFPNCIKIGPRNKPYFEDGFAGFTDMTLDQAMGLLWRVKTWECNVSGTWSYISSIDQNLNATLTFTDTSYREMDRDTSINKEEDLVCGIQFLYSLYEIPVSVFFPSEPPAFSSITNCEFYIGSNDISKVGDVYFPTLSTNCEFENSIDPDRGFTPIGTYNIRFLDFVITRPTYTITFETQLLGSQTIDIRAKEYWSYGGTYDTATGEPL